MFFFLHHCQATPCLVMSMMPPAQNNRSTRSHYNLPHCSAVAWKASYAFFTKLLLMEIPQPRKVSQPTHTTAGWGCLDSMELQIFRWRKFFGFCLNRVVFVCYSSLNGCCKCRNVANVRVPSWNFHGSDSTTYCYGIHGMIHMFESFVVQFLCWLWRNLIAF